MRVDAVSKVAELELAEKEKMKDKVAKILKHGCSVFINRQLIYNYPEQLFADAGVMAIEHADFEGVERLALVTGEPGGMTIVLITQDASLRIHWSSFVTFTSTSMGSCTLCCFGVSAPRNGIACPQHQNFTEVRFGVLTGGEIVSTFDSPETVRLGQCDVIEEIMIGEDKLLKFSGQFRRLCSARFVLRTSRCVAAIG